MGGQFAVVFASGALQQTLALPFKTREAAVNFVKAGMSAAERYNVHDGNLRHYVWDVAGKSLEFVPLRPAEKEFPRGIQLVAGLDTGGRLGKTCCYEMTYERAVEIVRRNVDGEPFPFVILDVDTGETTTIN